MSTHKKNRTKLRIQRDKGSCKNLSLKNIGRSSTTVGGGGGKNAGGATFQKDLKIVVTETIWGTSGNEGGKRGFPEGLCRLSNLEKGPCCTGAEPARLKGQGGAKAWRT